MTCTQHDWVYQQQLPDHPTRSLTTYRDNGNTNVRMCRTCQIEEWKVWVEKSAASMSASAPKVLPWVVEEATRLLAEIRSGERDAREIGRAVNGKWDQDFVTEVLTYVASLANVPTSAPPDEMRAMVEARELLTKLEAELDLQTYDQKQSHGFDAPNSAEYNVNVTAGAERAFREAVATMDVALDSTPDPRAPAGEGEVLVKQLREAADDLDVLEQRFGTVIHAQVVMRRAADALDAPGDVADHFSAEWILRGTADHIEARLAQGKLGVLPVGDPLVTKTVEFIIDVIRQRAKQAPARPPAPAVRIRANELLIAKYEARAAGGHPDGVKQSDEWREAADALILSNAALREVGQ